MSLATTLQIMLNAKDDSRHPYFIPYKNCFNVSLSNNLFIETFN